MDKNARIIQHWWRGLYIIQEAKHILHQKKTTLHNWLKLYRNDDELTQLCLSLEDKLYTLQNKFFIHANSVYQINNIYLKSIVSRLLEYGTYDIIVNQNNTITINNKLLVKVIHKTLHVYKIITKHTPAYTKITNKHLFSSKAIDHTFYHILSFLSK